jgi:hypothetical protein
MVRSFCAFVLAYAIIQVTGQQIAATPTDFDGDARSEFVTVEPSTDGALQFSSTTIQTGVTRSDGVLGVLGDHVALGSWSQVGAPQLAVISKGTNSLTWTILSSDGETTSQAFGALGDTVLSGADTDGDGLLDALTTSASGRRRVWNRSQSLFTSTRRDSQFAFGFSNETPLFVTQGARGLPATILTGLRGATTLRVYDPLTQRARRIRLPRAPTTTRPHPLRLSANEDALLFVVPEGSGLRLVTQSISAPRSKPLDFTMDSPGTIVIGDFIEGGGEEVGIHTETTLTVYSPLTSAVVSFTVPSGIAVDEININSFASSSPTPPDTPRPPTAQPTPISGDPTAPTDPSLAAVCASFSPISPGEMLIKSDPSNHIGRHDPRTTGYTVVCARECPANTRYVQFFYANGEFAGAVAKYGIFSGNGRPRLYGAVGAAPQHDAAVIAARAAGIGNGKLYLQVSSATSGHDSRCKEFSPSGRNGSL